MKVHHNTAKKALSHKLVITTEDNEFVVSTRDGRRLTSGLQANKVLDAAIEKLVAEHPITKMMTKSSDKQIARGAKKVIADAAATAKKSKASKEADRYEEAATAEGWKKTRAGFKQDGVGEEEGGVSEAKTWRELCEEQDIEVETEEGNGRSIVKKKYKEKYRPTKMTCGDTLAQKISAHVTYHDDENDKPMIDRVKLQRFAEANGCWVASYKSLNSGMMRMNIRNRLAGLMRKDPKFKIVWPE